MAAGMPNPAQGSGRHVVLFYRDGVELADQVSEHLLEALRAGGVAVVVATPVHRESITAALARAGIDVAAAQAAGRYVALDAFETLTQFVVADWPSAASFWQAISPVVSRAAETGAPVHMFGEMVALLWDFGQVNAAIEVEALWNEIGAQYEFSLLCAYPADSVDGDQHQDALAEVCRVHAGIVGDLPGRE